MFGFKTTKAEIIYTAVAVNTDDTESKESPDQRVSGAGECGLLKKD